MNNPEEFRVVRYIFEVAGVEYTGVPASEEALKQAGIESECRLGERKCVGGFQWACRRNPGGGGNHWVITTIPCRD